MDLFSLSAELRNIIYEMVIDNHSTSSDGSVLIQVIDDLKCDPHLGLTSHMPPLLHICYAIRHETEALYFARTTFRAQILYDEAHILIKWLERLSPFQRSQITKLVIEFPGDDLEAMQYMVAAKLHEEQSPEGLEGDQIVHERRSQEGFKIPSKPRNAKECVIDYLGVRVEGVKREAFEVKCWNSKIEQSVEVLDSGEGTLVEISDSLLFCLGCLKMAEPEDGVFTEQVCEECTDVEFEKMAVLSGF